MLRITRNPGALIAICAALVASPVLASGNEEPQSDGPAFALMDLRGTTAWAISTYQWLEPSEDALDAVIGSVGKGPMRLDLVMDNIVPSYCEMRPDPQICDGPGNPVSWLEDVPQTICMEIPSPVRARHRGILANASQLCLEPTSNLAFPKDWPEGTSWSQIHLHQTVTPTKITVDQDTATIELVISDAIATRLATLSEQGYGPVQIGWDQATLRKTLGPQLDQFIAGDDENCTFLQRNLDPSGLGYLVLDDKLARVSLYADEYDVATSLVRTAQGVSLGSTREDVHAAFGDAELVEEEHEYLGADARYVTWWTDAAKSRGIRFEFNEDGVVTAIHAGNEAITLVEGCS